MDVSRNNPNCCLLEPIESVEISNDLVGFLIDSLSKMLEFEINMDQACRSCLKEDSAMMTIHNPVDIDVVPKSSYTLAEILMECTTIKILPDDNLPQSICVDCVEKVQNAFVYKKMCENSDEKLRTYVHTISNIEIKPNIPIEENTTNSVFVPEMVDFSDSYEHPDLFDENVDDGQFDGDIFDNSPIQSDTEPNDQSESINADELVSASSKSQHKEGEDFRLVNRAKQINGRYQCELCEKTLADRRTFLLHTRLHLGKNLKHCNICGKGFAKKNHLDRHQKVHAAKKSRKRKQTEVGSDADEPMAKTAKKDDNQRVKCKTEKHLECSENGIDNSLLNTNEEIKLEALEVFDGKQNNKNDDTSSNVNQSHSIAYDDDEQKLVNSAKQVNGRLQCPICPRTLSQRKILKLHIRSHLGKNLLYCKICNRGFAKGSNLNRHMLLHCTVDNDEENQIIKAATQSNGCFSCPFCAKTLVDRQTFRLHIRLHISKGLVRCEICNRGFGDDDELQKHMTSHGSEFSCMNCDQMFETFRERKTHMRSVHNADTSSSQPNEIGGGRNDVRNFRGVNDDDDDEDRHIVNESNCVNGRFECVFCKKTLANRTTLKYHIRLHLGKNLLICDICKQGFSKKSHLKRHIATHIKKKPCRFCDAVFETYEERKIHSATVHKDVAQNHSNKTIIVSWTQPNGQKQCICMICNRSFNHIFELKQHLDWHTNDLKSFDGIDFTGNDGIFSKFNDLNRENHNIGMILHERIQQNTNDLSKVYCITNEHGWELSLSDSETEMECDGNEFSTEPKYNCAKCQQHFNRLHKLMCHMKVGHSSVEFQSFKCSHCMQYFPNANVLSKHLRQQCDNPNKSLVCLLCNNRFTWQNSLDKHVAIYHAVDSKFITDKITNVRPFNCEQCIKSFHRLDQLEAHKLSHIPRPKKFACDICKKRFSRTDNLKSHMRIHIPIEEREQIVNKHLCSYCGRSFSNSSNLTVHIRRHTGERPFSCEFCSARFPRSSDLACHRRTHTGEKTCVCTVCGKGFTRSNKLVRHMRIHTGERPYKCSHCGRAFTQSNDLTLHVRRHTGDKPFGCYCGERFITNSLLQSHRRSAGHMEDSSTALPSNSVNNPHRKFGSNDGKRTGITAALSNYLNADVGDESNITNL